mmetsp:Transcript_61633/g.84742  ORF Transcript_61633/g.84742 Transcript_61633/m.84742 type:complete len:297 (-) Transcript_61633:429-1319(-)
MGSGVISTASQSNVLMIMNMPVYLEDCDVRRLLQPFGKLKAYNMLRSASGQSKGTVVFEFKDPEVTTGAFESLNGVALGEIKMLVQRVPPEMAATLLKPINDNSGDEPSEGQGGRSGGIDMATSDVQSGAVTGSNTVVEEEDENESLTSESVVIVLSNMITEDVLKNNMVEELEDVEEDVRDESDRFGCVKAIKIPRKDEYGAGKIFVEFSDVGGAAKARSVMDNRSFCGKRVKARFYPFYVFADKINGTDNGTQSTEDKDKGTDPPGTVQGTETQSAVIGTAAVNADLPIVDIDD